MHRVLNIVERLLMAVTLGGICYIVYFTQHKTLTFPVPSVGRPLASPQIMAEAATAAKPYSFYAAAIKSRDIFSLAVKATEPSAPNAPAAAGGLPGHLKVVGIVTGYPTQVVIEDMEAHQTYFIQEGKPQGDLRILRVSANKVYLNVRGQDVAIPFKKDILNAR